MLRCHVLVVCTVLVAELFVLGVCIVSIADISCIGCSFFLDCSGRQLNVVL
jgi:hypothetical protein